MKRRTFVKLATATTVALYLPGLSCRSKESGFVTILSQPNFLQHICDAKTLHEIGEAYQHQAKEEDNKTTLVKLLSTDSEGKPIDESADSSSVAAMLDQKIQMDFDQDKTVVVDGWVLSVTEARQCALYSLTEK